MQQIKCNSAVATKKMTKEHIQLQIITSVNSKDHQKRILPSAIQNTVS